MVVHVIYNAISSPGSRLSSREGGNAVLCCAVMVLLLCYCGCAG